MNTPQIFNFEENEVRTVLVDDEPYFVGKDVADVLGYSNTAKAIRDHVDIEDRRSERIVHPSGGAQDSVVINESGLYSLILKSKLPSARKFKRWVTSEVLPQIRKHGMYATDELLNNPDLLIEVATKLKEERTQRLIAEQRVNELKPKALFADAVRGSTNSCLIKDLALMLNQNGINIGQNRLFAYMRKHKYLGSGKGHYNKPTQKSMDKDLFEYREHFHTNSSGEVEVRFTPLVTGKGQEYFVNEFLDSETA